MAKKREEVAIDDILFQEICSLKNQLKIAVNIIKKYQPDTEFNEIIHSLSTEDINEYHYQNGVEEGYRSRDEEIKKLNEEYCKCITKEHETLFKMKKLREALEEIEQEYLAHSMPGGIMYGIAKEALED